MKFNSRVGNEQAGQRPAVVLSPWSYNARSGLALVAPITLQRKGYAFEVPLPAGLPIEGCVLADHVRSLDWRVRAGERIGRLPPDIEALVRATVRRLLE